jgi:hypothetical protein
MSNTANTASVPRATSAASAPISPLRKARIGAATENYKLLTEHLHTIIGDKLLREKLHIINHHVLLIVDARTACNALYSANSDHGHKFYVWELLRLSFRIVRMARLPNKKDWFLIRHYIDKMRY